MENIATQVELILSAWWFQNHRGNFVRRFRIVIQQSDMINQYYVNNYQAPRTRHQALRTKHQYRSPNIQFRTTNTARQAILDCREGFKQYPF